MAFQNLDFVFTIVATGAAQLYKGGPGTIQITAGAFGSGTVSVEVSLDGGVRFVPLKDDQDNALSTLSANAFHNFNISPCLMRMVVLTATITTGQAAVRSRDNVTE